MPLTQGEDLSWYEEFTPDDYTVGHFRGDLTALNIRNAQPGYTYYYVRNNTSDMIRFLNQGWSVVDANDPERYGANALNDKWSLPTNLGTEHAYKDVALMKIPIDRYREIQHRKDEERKTQLNGVVHSYLDRGADRARELHRPPNGRSHYYANPDHGQVIEEK